MSSQVAVGSSREFPKKPEEVTIDGTDSNFSLEEASSQSLSILVLNYNGLTELVDCIASLRKTDYPTFNIVVVDNGSSDGSVERIKEHFPWIRVIPLDKNYGFGLAYNKAMGLVNSKYVLLLNNDITASKPDWLSSMVHLAESSPDIGAVGPKLVVESNPKLLDAVGGIVYRWMGCSPLGHGEVDKGQYDRPATEVFYMGGGALLMLRELYIRLGGFDPTIFAYAEDLDLCWRLRLIGYRIAYCPEAVLLHKGSSLWKKSTIMKLRLSQQNFLYCCLKNYSATSLLKELPILAILNLAGSLATSILDKRSDVFFTVLKSLTANLFRLKKTIFFRGQTQRTRAVSEASILSAMGPQRLMSLRQMRMKSRDFMHSRVR